MRTIAALLLTLACASSTLAQIRDARPELDVQGRVTESSVSPSGDLWIATATGHAYRSDDGGRTWAEVNVPSRKMRPPESWLSDQLDRVMRYSISSLFEGRFTTLWSGGGSAGVSQNGPRA